MKFNPFGIFLIFGKREQSIWPELKKVHETKQSNNAINIEQFIFLLHFSALNGGSDSFSTLAL